MSMPPRSDLIGAALFAALFLLALGAAELLRRRGLCAPEASRKLVHFCGGLLALWLPRLVRSPSVVLIMSVSLSLLFLWARRHGALRSVHGVARRTGGAEYFPLAVFLVYILAYDRYWLYVCALLVLAAADTFAALVGSAYGRVRYEVDDETRSLEGSAVFLIIAFLSLHLPMLLMTDLPRVVCVLAALLVAALVTGFEAVSMGGADNLFVPLGVAVILTKITGKPVPEIVYQNASLAALGLVMVLAARGARSFNAGGIIMFVLFAYGAWSLGSELWALPILAGFFVYMAVLKLFPTARDGGRRMVRARVLFRALVIPLLPLVAGNMFRRESFFFAPFAVSLAAALAFAIWSRVPAAFKPAGPRRAAMLALAAFSAWAAAIAPVWALTPGRVGLAPPALAAVVVLAAAWLDDRLLGPSPCFEGDRAWPASRVALSAAACAAIVLAQYWGLVRPWPC